MGDKAEVYKTNILKEFPFPEFDDEDLITELDVIGVFYNL